MSKHTENAITLAANMMHDARNGQSVEIGSGVFSPEELRMGAETLRASADLLAALNQTLQSLTTHLEQIYLGKPGEQYINEHPAVIAAKAAIAKAQGGAV